MADQHPPFLENLIQPDPRFSCITRANVQFAELDRS
jgi:hypothetical protein